MCHCDGPLGDCCKPLILCLLWFVAANAAAAALASLEDGCNASRSSSPEELSAGSTLQVHDSVRVVISKYDKGAL